MDLSYLPLAPSDFPVEITYALSGVNYDIEFRHNDVNNFYSILIKDAEGNALYASRIKYLATINHTVVDDMPIKEILRAFSVEDILSNVTREIVVDESVFGGEVQLYVIPEI